MADRVGQHMGNYRLVALLGQGSYAEVYLGQHVRLPLHVALKVLHSHLTGHEAEHFQQEAETIARLAHPSIVRILDYDVQSGVPFLVMDYAPSGSLRRRYPKGTVVSLLQIVSYVKQIAAALQYAHEQKVIHRDVKPENMLLGRHEEVLLSDFGLAALAHSSASLSTQEAMGTLPYMAPEQIEGHPRAASDQYALGVVVYEWLCGGCPFEGSFSEVLVQHLSIPPPPLRERVPAIPGEVEQVVLKTLAKDPKERFASVQDFSLALEGACTAASPGATRLMLASGYAAETLLTTKHNLPAYLTPLVGREQEVVEACTLLRRPEVRLVTLTGTGGIGKTRLALQLATELLADFADGVYFVALAPISDPDLVVPTIAQLFEIKEAGDWPLLERLQAHLQEKQLLLLLDNFEQILSASASLADLLVVCPHLKILVTSRAVLHVQGEQEFPVPPLAVPDFAHLPEREALTAYAAVALFLQRAQAVKPDFQLTKANARAVAAICTRLDGLPLAIELAAARIKLLPPPALLARLEHRLAVLTGGALNLPARQQTLRNTLEWSYQLLDADEQRLFRRLAVFVGGCTLEAIEAVCAALDSDAVAMPVLDAVSSLIDKSLLQQTEQGGGEPRLTMLETIREYGREVFSRSGEMATARQAHAAYYLAQAQEAAREYTSSQQVEWLERLEQEHDNLRATMEWLLDPAQAGSLLEMAYRLGEALTEFWWVRCFHSEARAFLERLLARSEGVSASLRAKTLNATASFTEDQGDLDRAETLWQESLALSRELGDIRGIASSLKGIGLIADSKGNHLAGRTQLEESLALYKEAGDLEAVAWSLFSLADNDCAHGDYRRGYTLFEESLAIFRELGNKRGIADCLNQSALLLFIGAQGDQATVHQRLEESLTIYRELGDKGGIAQNCWVKGWVAFKQGDTQRAHGLMEQSLVLNRETGLRWHACFVLAFLGRIKAHRGDFVGAHALLEESLVEARTLDDWPRAFCLECLAVVVAAQAEHAWATRLLSAAESLREICGTPVSPVETDYEPAMVAARTSLGEQAFATAWAEGRSMSFEQVLTEAGRSAISTPVSTVRASKATMGQAMYPAGLTAREVEVLRLVAQGLSNAQIAEQLVISLLTVKAHMRSLYNKLSISSRSAATRYAIEHQLV
jgi:predicted ATPase/DNA-binding CsgD family transcriptional regulator